MGIAAPVIVAEMAEWVAVGGGNSGIVGDAAHSFGFHVAADELPASDYSRTRDPNGPDGPYINWDYACAGDFSHRNDERLRAMHRNVLARLMRGDLPMICEFIGKPWADRPVYYWARWNGVGTLQRYTGSGHDTWSHISWFRSRVNERAHLWKVEDDMAEWFNGPREETLAWRIESGVGMRDEVVGGQTAGEPNLMVQAIKDIQRRVAGLEAIDYEKLATALAPKVAALMPKPATPDQIADKLRDRLAG